MPQKYPDLEGLSVRQLKEFCKERRIAGYSKYPRKADLLAFIRERVGAIAADCESEVGGEAPQAPDVQPLDVASLDVPAGDGVTPDVALAVPEGKPASGAFDSSPPISPSKIAAFCGAASSHPYYIAPGLVGELVRRFLCSDSTGGGKQKSPQAAGTNASRAWLALPWGDFCHQGAVPTNSAAMMGCAATSIALAGGSCNSELMSELALISADLRGIASTRNCITITAPYFPQVMNAMPPCGFTAGDPTRMAVVGRAKRAIANPVRAP